MGRPRDEGERRSDERAFKASTKGSGPGGRTCTQDTKGL